MSEKSKFRAKVRFRVMYRTVKPVEGDWKDYYGSSRTYMQACEEVDRLNSQEKYHKVDDQVFEYEYKVVYEKLLKGDKQ